MLRTRAAGRRGSTIVETALVMSVFCLLLFGVFEYSRFLYVQHVTQNAASAAARYAVVNMDKPSTFDTTDYTDTSGTTFVNIEAYATARMSGAERQLSGYDVAVFAVDPAGLALATPVIRPKTTSTGASPTYPDPFNSSDPNKVAWNQTSFPQRVAVSIKGDYKPVLPGLMFMPSTIPVLVTSMASSEG